jgi:hypothetical protein
MLDSLAHRYGCLPSEVIARANTLDLFVIDAAISYDNYQQRLQSGKLADEYTTTELQSMMENFRGD